MQMKCEPCLKAQRSSAARWRVRTSRLIVPLLAAVVLMFAAALGVGARIARADGSGTLHIDRPHAGPAGANVFIKVGGAAASQTFSLGFSTQDAGCASSLAPLTGAPNITTDGSGNYSGSFVWPADTGTGTFFVCASATIQNSPIILQSDNVYTVQSASPPSITLAHAVAAVPTANPIPIGGTPVPTATPEPDGVYTVGDQVQMTGASFLPGGTTLTAWISGDQNDLGEKLPLSNGSGTFNADSSGNFQVTVTLPGYRIGQVYLHVTSNDAKDGGPPTLRADASAISVSQAATPTPNPTATPSPSPTPTGSSGSTGTADVGRILGVAGLGAFSVLLLMIGTILLISAGTMRHGV